MLAQRRSAALFDGRHDLQLPEAQVTVLARRHAGPKARKMSATSSAGATTMRLRRLQHLQRTDDFAQQVGGDLR